MSFLGEAQAEEAILYFRTPASGRFPVTPLPETESDEFGY